MSGVAFVYCVAWHSCFAAYTVVDVAFLSFVVVSAALSIKNDPDL